LAYSWALGGGKGRFFVYIERGGAFFFGGAPELLGRASRTFVAYCLLFVGFSFNFAAY
jgi:hypothetical protein